MAHFYGTVQGNRGRASRTGSKASGIETWAAAWHGAIHTECYDRDGQEWARIRHRPWLAGGANVTLYDGPLTEDRDAILAAALHTIADQLPDDLRAQVVQVAHAMQDRIPA